MAPKKYDSTVARMAGNIAAGNLLNLHTHIGTVSSSTYLGPHVNVDALAREAVSIARAIVAEVERTEPAELPAPATVGS